MAQRKKNKLAYLWKQPLAAAMRADTFPNFYNFRHSPFAGHSKLVIFSPGFHCPARIFEPLTVEEICARVFMTKKFGRSFIPSGQARVHMICGAFENVHRHALKDVHLCQKCRCRYAPLSRYRGNRQTIRKSRFISNRY